MRKLLFAFAAFLVTILPFGVACNDSDEVTGPVGPMPSIEFIDDNPTYAGSVLIFAGKHFDETSTFTLRQGGMVRATLIERLLATGNPTDGIQVDVTIPPGTAVGTYEACVTTSVGTGCYAHPVGVI